MNEDDPLNRKHVGFITHVKNVKIVKPSNSLLYKDIWILVWSEKPIRLNMKPSPLITHVKKKRAYRSEDLDIFIPL